MEGEDRTRRDAKGVIAILAAPLAARSDEVMRVDYAALRTCYNETLLEYAKNFVNK